MQPPPLYTTTLSLHDALPIFRCALDRSVGGEDRGGRGNRGGPENRTVPLLLRQGIGPRLSKSPRIRRWVSGIMTCRDNGRDRKSTRLNPVTDVSRMPSSA